MIAENPLRKEDWTQCETDDVCKFLYEHYEGKWPQTARIYHNSVAKENDVTPSNEKEIERLNNLDGILWVVVYPAYEQVAYAVIAALVQIVISEIIVAFTDDTPDAERRNFSPSPNNQLGRRSNTARPIERIPDIIGTVKSVPDLIMVPWVRYIDNREVETAYYCVGRGEYDVQFIRDGDTLVSEIQSASAQVYGPGGAPTTGDPGPDIQIGDVINDDVYNVYQVDAVNGQILEPINKYTLYSEVLQSDGSFDPMIFTYVSGSTGRIEFPTQGGHSVNTSKISIGDNLYVDCDSLSITNATSAGPPLTIDEFYVVTNVEELIPEYTRVTVTIPASKVATWAAFGAPQTPIAQVTKIDDNLYRGPFFVDFTQPLGSTSPTLVCNFVAPNGLYKDDSARPYGIDVKLQVVVTEANDSGTPIGTPVATDVFIGSPGAQGQISSQVAVTAAIPITHSGKFIVQVRRIYKRQRNPSQRVSSVTESAYGELPVFAGNQVDEVRWTHCYFIAKPPQSSFGDVTTIYTRTFATEGAIRTKNRELNCTVSRKTNVWNGSTFSGPIASTGLLEDYLFHVMKDEYIGNLDDQYIDFQQIADACQEIRDTMGEFAASTHSLFGHTFDNASVSFEEILQSIANACYGQVYREGSVFKLKPVVSIANANILYNHRNILPGTQKITHTFGPVEENDGVEVEYRDAFTGEADTVIVPQDVTVSAPKKLQIIGLRSKISALIHAYRAYQRMTLQRQAVEFDTTEESALVISKDKIMVEDRTRSDCQAGYITSVSGLTVETSQPVDFGGTGPYTVFLQHVDGTVEAIVATAGSHDQEMTLASAPSVTLVTDDTAGLPTNYILVERLDTMPTAYMVSEKSPEGRNTYSIRAYNYNHMYYIADGIQTWLRFTTASLFDHGTKSKTFSGTGSSFVNDSVRGFVWNGTGSNQINVASGFSDLISFTDYTKSVWVKNVPSSGTIKNLISSPDGSNHFLRIDEIDRLECGHVALSIFFSWIPFIGDGIWHHIAQTWKESTQSMRLYVDGVQVGQATPVNSPSQPARYFDGFQGLADEVAWWSRTFSADEVRDLYLTQRLS